MFRHEKTFYHAPGLVLRVKDTEPAEAIARMVDASSKWNVERVGIILQADGYAIENEKLVEQYERQMRRFHELTAADGVQVLVKGQGKECGKVDGDRITDIKFKTFGCGAAVATSSMVTELVKGKTIHSGNVAGKL
jgi:CO dehydrogenase/acetyl-CoA synthase gamma subunit (corrinoid Fe-S protein)